MDTEYEVETILKAKVFMKGKKMGWKFYVKWKGYQDTDNTWEPFKSFESSGEEIVGRFWDRVDTKGRDVNSIQGWTNGEEVYPIGPPRRKSKTTLRKDEPTNARSPTDERPSSRGTTNGTRAKRPSEPLESQRSSKRKRASSSRRKSDTQASQRSRPESRTPIPDSQSEDELLMVTSPKKAVADMLADIDVSNLVDQVNHRNAITSSSQEQAEEPGHHDRPLRVSDPVKSPQPSTQTMVEDVDLSVASSSYPGADPSQEPVAAQTQRSKNIERGLKGRNTSLLTFSKKTGVLETLRRTRAVKDNGAVGDTEEVIDHPESTNAALASAVLRSGSSNVEVPPQGSDGTATAAEQNHFASQGDTDNHTLPDYEEQNQPCPSSPKIELPDKMPTSISFPELSSGGSSPWKRTTIFGPLAIGTSPSCATSWGTSNTGSSPSIPKPFLLRLDNSISVPVALKDVSSTQAIPQRLESIVSGTTDPPGKLYTSHAAMALLETLENGGSCARLVPGDTATTEHRRIFDAFCAKLGEGGLFVVMASSEVLACCSSTNEDYTKKLALPTALRGLSETVVVSHVKVANYSAFADAAAQAESVRW